MISSICMNTTGDWDATSLGTYVSITLQMNPSHLLLESNIHSIGGSFSFNLATILWTHAYWKYSIMLWGQMHNHNARAGVWTCISDFSNIIKRVWFMVISCRYWLWVWVQVVGHDTIFFLSLAMITIWIIIEKIVWRPLHHSCNVVASAFLHANHTSSVFSWNESSQQNLAEKPANFAGCQLLYTTLCFIRKLPLIIFLFAPFRVKLICGRVVQALNQNKASQYSYPNSNHGQ